MEELVREAVDATVPLVEAIGAIVVVGGVVASFAVYAASELRIRPRPYEQVRIMLARFLALGLEFQLGADILATAVSPTWDDIGKLGAIAGIRTVLNYTLAHDIRRAGEFETGGAAGVGAARR